MSDTPPTFLPSAPAEAGLDAARLARAGALLDEMTASGAVTGAALVVARHGRLGYERYAGLVSREPARPASVATLWLLASITKPVAAAGIMLLVERGLLALDDPVADILPGFGVNGKETITTRHLLTHTSGIDDRFAAGPPPPDATPESRSATAYATGVTWPPGSRAAYNNVGYMLLADIIARLTGESHTAFLQRELFAPLGLADTRLGVAADEIGDRLSLVDDVDPELTAFLIGSGSLAGGLVSTPRDVAAFGQFFLNRGRAGGRALLAPATVAAMLRDHAAGLEEANGESWAPAAGRGLAWRLNSRPPGQQFCDLASPHAYGHGGATGTLLVIDPAYDLVIAFMANRWAWPGRERRRLLNAVYAALVD